MSPWEPTAIPEGPRLHGDLRVDVCVVGAGIAGITTAIMLSREGKSVAVLDHGPVGGGQTGRTTAHLSNAIDDRFVEIERLHGPGGARICAESHIAAIETIATIVEDGGIDCDFERVDGYLFEGLGKTTVSLEDELEAARAAGLRDVEMLPRLPLDGFEAGPCLRFPRQAQFHPLKYLRALTRSLTEAGHAVHTDSHVEDIEPGRPVCVRVTGGRSVVAQAVVVATNSPISSRFAIHTKQAPYQTYAIGAPIPPGSVRHALYWDTLDPYHYVRVAPRDAEHELLIVGGEDRKSGTGEDTMDRFADLERWGRERFPVMREVTYRWSGQVMQPVDGVAFIGPAPGDAPNVYVATGDSGMGMTHGTIAGILISDLVMGRSNPWTDLYDPSRITSSALGRFLREGADAVAGLGGWLTGGEVESAAAIPVGQGAVLRRGLMKVAVYRDPEGVLHERSAACTHLGCVVAWNPIAKTWDCRCHGSRFDPYGRVVNGPAVLDLSPVES